MNNYILTTQPGAGDTAIGELQKIDAAVRTAAVFSSEIRMIETTGDGKFPPLIFTRHIFPVTYTGEISPEETVPKSETREILHGIFAAQGNAAAETLGRKFSVQLRVVNRDEAVFARAVSVLESAEAILNERGFIKDDRRPEWALSLLVNDGTLYAGASSCADNFSRWNGGEARFKKDENFISRAEFKLLEAFEVFGIAAAPSALDLGAAPGGWTKALLDRGFSVTAVDPAGMHQSLLTRSGLTYIPKTIQRCGFADKSFDMIVNDMRMDIFDSARIMNDCAKYLRPGGTAVMTLKLTKGHWLQKTEKALKILEESYEILGARQLFHNRDEVTAVMFAK